MSLRPGEKTAEELATMSDDEIDYSDIPQLPEEFWANARWVTPEEREAKLHLKKEIEQWIKKHGKEYPYIDAILKSYVEKQQPEKSL